jgi:hypothetical protein
MRPVVSIAYRRASRTIKHLAARIASDLGQARTAEVWRSCFPSFPQHLPQESHFLSRGSAAVWLGWNDKDMTDLYDRIREDAAFRKEWAEKAGLGFEIPPIPKGIRRSAFPPEVVVIGRNGRKTTEKRASKHPLDAAERSVGSTLIIQDLGPVRVTTGLLARRYTECSHGSLRRG